MKISDCVSALQYSPIRRFNPIAAEAKKNGKKVYHLNIGQPDVATPDCFMDEIRSFDKSVLAYEQSQGDSGLVDAIRNYFRRDFGVEFAKEDILTTMGASEALTMTFSIILNNSEEVLIPEPFYSNYSTFVAVSGGKLRPVTTVPEKGYNYADRALLDKQVNDKTRAIVCINPGNPTGFVLTKDEMELIADFAIENDLWIIADEAYREFVYDGREPITFASIDRIKDRLIVVDSVSKRYSACGARVGYIASKNREFMEGALKLAQARLCIPTIDQIGAAALFNMEHEYYEEMKKEYEGRRDAAYEEIMKIPDVVCLKPGGAFYMTIDLPVEDAEDFLMFMLTEYSENNETTMFAPAAGFYGTSGAGKSEIRIAYVLNKKDIRRACELIRTGLEAYKLKCAK